MAIFAKRTLARIFGELAPILPEDRQRDLRGRLASAAEGDGPISAEWEIVLFNALRKGGTLEFPSSDQRQSDVIFTSAATGERAMVEITAISDKGLREKNPVEEFARWLGKIAYKLRPIAGGFDYDLGYAEVDDEYVLGIPTRADIPAFFKSPAFRAFLDEIRKAPLLEHRHDFQCRGSSSWIGFRPGSQFGSGHYIAFDGIHDLRKNRITSRLRAKNAQFRHSGVALPGIVVLCDGDCAALRRETTGLGKPMLKDVSDVFLNGRQRRQAGEFILQTGIPAATRRINAVIVIAAKETREVFSPHVTRYFQVGYALNHGPVYHPVSQDTLEALCHQIHENLPPMRTNPINARRVYERPAHYGGWSLAEGQGGTVKVKISLLTLQGLLDGTIKQEQFLRDHPDIERALLKFNVDGRMISGLRIERCPDDDDDWIQIEFGERHPNRLFEKKT